MDADHPFQHLIWRFLSVFDSHTKVKIILVFNKKLILLIIIYVKIAHHFYLKISSTL